MTKSIFFQRLSATIQFILGFVIGISLIAGVSSAFIYAYYQRMSVLPKKPNFPEVTASSESPTESADDIDIEPLESNTVLQAEPEAEPEAELEAELELPPNAYRAVVTWPEGLSLRSEPSINADRIGGIAADASIIILEDSTDSKWQRVRLPWNGQEGWVKGGNTERTSN